MDLKKINIKIILDYTIYLIFFLVIVTSIYESYIE